MPAFARAEILCDLAQNLTFEGASRVLANAGCRVTDEDGFQYRAFECSADGLNAYIDKERYGSAISLSVMGNISPGFDPTNCGLPPARYFTPQEIDNPLVLSHGVYGPVGREVAIARLGLAAPGWVWMTSGSVYRSRLRETLGLTYGSSLLDFEASQVRIAGLDITSATAQNLRQSLTERGANRTTETDDDGLERYESVAGVPGLNWVEVNFAHSRVLAVKYGISDLASYTAFVESMDDRYGASQRSERDRCARRNWANGGVFILGVFCENSPEESGFTFLNSGLYDVMQAYLEALRDSETSSGTDQERPRVDMY